MSPIASQSQAPSDALTGPGACGDAAEALGGFQDRCGYGPRLPLLVVSPFARSNFVDHAITDQSSILRVVEDNWKLSRIGGGSFDGVAGSIDSMFDFNRQDAGGTVSSSIPAWASRRGRHHLLPATPAPSRCRRCARRVKPSYPTGAGSARGDRGRGRGESPSHQCRLRPTVGGVLSQWSGSGTQGAVPCAHSIGPLA